MTGAPDDPYDPDVHHRMLELLEGAWVTQALHVAARLRLAEALAGGPRTAAQLADARGAHPGALARLLRYLTVLGVLTEHDGGYAVTPLGATLAVDHPRSMHDRAIAYGGYLYGAWGRFEHAVTTGRPAFPEVYGCSAYEYLAGHPDDARRFDRQMRTGAPAVDAVPKLHDLSRARTVIDVAGGDGTLLTAVLAAVPGARGVLVDTPHVVAAAGETLRAAGLPDRVALVGGDIFGALPAGDVYLLSRILHNWDDERCLALLRGIADAAPDGAELLVVERMIGAVGDAQAIASDLHMLTVYGGRERTAGEYRELLAAAGFVAGAARDLPPDWTLLAARRAVRAG